MTLTILFLIFRPQTLSNDIVYLNVSVSELQEGEDNLSAKVDHALDLINRLSSLHLGGSSTTEIISEAASSPTSVSAAKLIRPTTSPSSFQSSSFRSIVYLHLSRRWSFCSFSISEESSTGKITSPGG